MRLYEFQKRILDTARRKIAGGARRLILCAPTGAGKTAISSAIISGARGKGKKCMFVCHRAELREQAKKTLQECGVKTGTIASNAFSALHLPVQVAQIGTLARRKEKWANWADVIIVDECHHIAARSWRETIAMLSKSAVVIGLTATPQRLDGKGLNEDFDEIIEGPGIRELIDSGHLADFDTYTTREKFDLAQVHIAMGDFSQRDLERQIGNKRVRNVVEAYRATRQGRQGDFLSASPSGIRGKWRSGLSKRALKPAIWTAKPRPRSASGLLKRLRRAIYRCFATAGLSRRGLIARRRPC